MDSAQPHPISVALVEDEDSMRTRLASAISSEPSLLLMHASASGLPFLKWLEENPVEVILVDLGLPDIAGAELIRSCRRLQPAAKILVVTMFGDWQTMLHAFEAGAGGYLLKDGTEADLAKHVRYIAAGGSPMTPILARGLLDLHGSAGATAAPLAGPAKGLPEAETIALTRRETEVLELVSRGFVYAEIAGFMKVGIATVQTHVRNIYAKLGVHNRTEAVHEARSLRILP
jgi:DNA-binding NarL/FixJ family response regulator